MFAMHRLLPAGLLCLVFLAFGALASQPDSARGQGPHIGVQLLSEQPSLVRGQEHWLGILFEPDPDWHTYWLNPGDSGEPPRVELQLPDGFSHGDWLWETPHVIPVAHLVNYGYARSMLMTRVRVPASAPDHVTLQASLTWLVCKEDCLPGDAQLALTLPVTDAAGALAPDGLADHVTADTAALFSQARQHHYSARALDAYFEINEQGVSLELPLPLSPGWQLLPFGNDWIDHAAPASIVVDGNTTYASFAISPAFWRAPATMQWLAIGPAPAESFSFTASPKAIAAPAEMAFALILLLAFAGGLILNVMPCVLPVLALKALSLTTPTHQQRLSGHAFLAGVMACFVGFALLIELARQAGETLGWGFQMQSPSFVLLLTLLLFALALWLLDALPLGHRLQQLAGSPSFGHGPGGSFLTGCLAVLVATPCTAPFMGAALGYGLQAGGTRNLAVFMALAAGFALPLWLLHLMPQLQRWMPGPGPWMQHFKHLLAYPLFLTCIWLLWVLGNLAGQTTILMALLAALGIALAAQLLRFNTAWIKACGLVLLGVSVALPAITLPQTAELSATVMKSGHRLEDIQQARANGKSVLVNVTADWCITCKVNEQLVFSTTAVQDRLNDDDLRYIEIDWTRKSPEILQYLQEFGRSGVPLYVFYPNAGDPVVLPQLLTPDLVLAHLKGE